MPKNKTHSGAKKRFKITGTGKLVHGRTNRGHLMEVKPSTRARRLAVEAEVNPADKKRAKKLLGR
jgi:large subunit ribosomal protein L35